MTGQKNSALGDGGDQGVPVHSLSVRADPLKTKGPETVSLRDEIIEIIRDDVRADIHGDLYGVERAAEFIERLLPPKGWRPIESAPSEDGAEAILWFPDLPEAELQVGRLRWYGDPSDEGSIGIWQDRYTGEDFENARDGMVFPTHFMPLPAAPVTKTVGGDND